MTQGNLRSIIASLTANQFNELVGGLLRLPAGGRVSDGDLLAAGLYEWAIHLGLPEPSVGRLVSVNLAELRRMPGDCFGGGPKPLIHVVDGRWGTVLGRPKWLDMIRGDEQDDIPGLPVTTITCALVPLFARLHQLSCDLLGARSIQT